MPSCLTCLRPDLQAFLFSPADADAERRAKLTKERLENDDGTPEGQGNGPGTNRKANPVRKPGARYTVGSYRRAIERGCEVAFGMPKDLKPSRAPEGATPDEQAAHAAHAEQEHERKAKRAEWRKANVWHPHQLRHNAATWLRKEFGIDVARIILGHTSDTMTAVYAERDRLKAREIMGKVG
jgi:integrase